MRQKQQQRSAYDAHDKAVLGGLVLVLVLRDQALAGIVVSLGLCTRKTRAHDQSARAHSQLAERPLTATAGELDLVALEVSGGLDNLDETLQQQPRASADGAHRAVKRSQMVTTAAWQHTDPAITIQVQQHSQWAASQGDSTPGPSRSADLVQVASVRDGSGLTGLHRQQGLVHKRYHCKTAFAADEKFVLNFAARTFSGNRFRSRACSRRFSTWSIPSWFIQLDTGVFEAQL